MENVLKTVLPNGLTIVTEEVESVKSLSVGIWVKTGSRNERVEQAGITHFLEHMLFKGTSNRNHFQIAQSLERVGGYLNAFTSNEHTCYYARCLDDELELALDVLCDMVLNPTFPADELEKEKKVVLEELKMYKDQPDDFLFEHFIGDLFKGHPLGRPIIGFEETINAYDRDQLYAYMNEFYQPWNLTIALAGKANHEKVVELVSKIFSKNADADHKAVSSPLTPYTPFSLKLNKDIEQTYYVLGKRSLSISDDDRYKLLLANTVLGAGMSSRLHQNVREKHGYCYAISTINQAYEDTGIFGVYAGTDKEYVDHLRELVYKEFENLQTTLIPENEFHDAKQQLKGSLILSQESMSNRMMRLGKSELYFKRWVSLDELSERIDSVTAEDVLSFSKDFFDTKSFSEARLIPTEA